MIQLNPRLLAFFALLLAFTARATADIAEAHRGYWLLVNSNLLVSIDSAGKLTLVNSGQTGTLTLAEDGTFEGTFGATPLRGKFAEGKLWIRRSAGAVPGSMEFLELRKITEADARELVTFLRQPRPPETNDLSLTFRASVADAIRQRLSLLSESVMFHCLEQGLEKVNSLQDLVGPDKQLSALPSIDGEDYRQLNLTPNTSWTIESASGIQATLQQ